MIILKGRENMKKSERLEEIVKRFEEAGESILASYYRNYARIERENEEYEEHGRFVFAALYGRGLE